MIIALCQVNPIVGAYNYNRDLILKYYQDCIKLNSDIIVFPELIISGYPPQDLLWEEGFVEENLVILQDIIDQSTTPLILGYIRKKGQHLYNSAAVCYNGKLQSSYDKVLLPTYDVFDEDRYFTSGNEPEIVTIPVKGGNAKIGVQICEDLWDHDYDCKVSQIQKQKGADLIINISASPYHEGRLIKRKEQIHEKVKKTGLPFLYCNMVVAQDELIFDG